MSAMNVRLLCPYLQEFLTAATEIQDGFNNDFDVSPWTVTVSAYPDLSINHTSGHWLGIQMVRTDGWQPWRGSLGHPGDPVFPTLAEVVRYTMDRLKAVQELRDTPNPGESK